MESTDLLIGDRIKEARKAKGLSQTELAEKLNKSMRTVQKYESGEIEPSISVINEIAEIVDVAPEILCGFRSSGYRMDTLADFFKLLMELDKKEKVHFDIKTLRSEDVSEFGASMIFDCDDFLAEYNTRICLFLENFKFERDRLKRNKITEEEFDERMKRYCNLFGSCDLANRTRSKRTYQDQLNTRDEYVLFKKEIMASNRRKMAARRRRLEQTEGIEYLEKKITKITKKSDEEADKNESK